MVGTTLAALKLHRDTILKVIVIPLAIVSALFLIVAGYNDRQIAPVMGLLGKVVGYVFGATKSHNGSDARNEAEDKKRPDPSKPPV